jgi:hypothetical protein
MTAPETAPSGDGEKKEATWRDFLITAVVLAVIGGLVWFFFFYDPKEDPADVERHRTEFAVSMCEKAAKDHLVSPGTAKFSDEQPEGDSKNGWTITGAVDAQNSLGGLMHSEFTCQATYDESTKETEARITDVQQRK